MSWTCQQVVTEVGKRFPDANSTSLMIWLNLVHRDICWQIPELQQDVVQVSLTQGTQEYDIAEYVFQVREAELVTAAGTSQKLEYMTVEELDAMAPGWKEQAVQGVPTIYYINSNQVSGNSEVIGLYPVPNTTTATYPYVVMQVSDIASSDLSTSSTLPPTIPSAQVYVEGVSKQAAMAIRRGMAIGYNSTYANELKSVQEYVKTRSAGIRPGANPNPRMLN